MASNNNTTNMWKTRSGISPDERELPYSITTHDVEEYLQKKVNTVLNRIAQQNGKGSNAEQIDVKVYTTEAGRDFLPFVVILPTDVLETKDRQKRKDTPSIFNTKDTDGTASMRTEFFNLFKCYVFGKEDETAFFSEDWRRARHVNRETSPVLKSMRTPKVTSMEGGRLQVVSFIIDPLRVFHDMLTINDDPRSFKVEIKGWQKMQTGVYRYDLNRVISKGKNKKYRDTVVQELNRRMKAGR